MSASRVPKAEAAADQVYRDLMAKLDGCEHCQKLRAEADAARARWTRMVADRWAVEDAAPST